MADASSAACRDWLGLEPTDLPFPHRVLGVSADEGDPLVIVRAADSRFEVLRGVPEDRGAERDALVAQVEAARDAMLAAAMATRGRPPAPPPAPPPVPPSLPVAPPPPMPPPVPAAATTDGWEPPLGERFPAPRRPRRSPVRSDSGFTSLAVTILVLAATALALYAAWPHLQKKRPPPSPVATRPEPGPSASSKRKPKPEPRPSAKPKPDFRRDLAEPKPQPLSQPEPRPEPEPEPVSEPPVSEPPVSASAVTPESTPPPAENVDEIHSQVDAAIARACTALREQDIASAKRDLEAVADVALGDQQAADRLQLWQLFVSYAEAWPGYRDKALNSAATGAGEFELGEVTIAVVELTPQEFIYRDSRRPGRNLRVPRDAIPPDIEELIIRTWFDADGRAANHLFLGAAALCRPTPDLDAARRDWETAASRGEDHGRLLLGILDDPAFRRAATSP